MPSNMGELISHPEAMQPRLGIIKMDLPARQPSHATIESLRQQFSIGTDARAVLSNDERGEILAVKESSIPELAENPVLRALQSDKPPTLGLFPVCRLSRSYVSWRAMVHYRSNQL